MNAIKRALFVLLACCTVAGGTVAKGQGLPLDYSSNVLETISFGGTNFEDDLGYPPLSWTNLTTVPGDGVAVLMDTNSCWLEYPLIQSGTLTNFSLQQGTVMLWIFLTNASSGVWSLDANQWGTFIEAGSYTPGAIYGWWSLRTDGSNILFGTQDNCGGQTNYLCAPINWNVASNQWMHLALTYAPSTNGTKLYINGALATNGPPMSVVPDTMVISNSFYLGSSGPSNLLHAAIDDIYFWNCPLDAATINDFFQAGYANFFLNPNSIGWFPGEVIPSAPFYTTNTSRAIMGTGFLQYVGTAPNWTSSSQVWMTNITATVGASGTVIYFTVMGGSNGLAYDTYATPALAGSGITSSVWSWMGQVFAGGRYALGGLPNTSAYIVLGTPTDQDGDSLCDSYELLISHSSPTDPGSDLPQGWLWAYFGDFNHSSTDLDSQGAYTLLTDYTYGLDPNVISFNISVTNQYVTAREIPVKVGVSAGVPASMALLVDSTNLAGATWVPYSSNMTAMTVVVGTNEGWHDIYLGMRGRPINSEQTWQGVRVKLDTRPPALVITGPSNSSVSVSMIQLTGYSAEALSRLTYDISNATGILTDRLAVVTGQYYETNTAEFTTNYFQAYDVALTSGLNVITVRAMDLAGNMATLTTNIVYAASTNPPALALLWPQDGMQMSGSNFTIKGRVDDPTATVSVSIVDTNGDTSILGGRTGRDGIFWIENVPLSAGTNALILIVIGVGGTNTADFSLIQSSVGLSINDVQAGDTAVRGSMDTAGYTIWVNGTKADLDGDTWTNQITPIGIGGGLVLVTAIPNSDNGGNGSGGGAGVNPYSAHSINTQATVQPAQGIYISAYHFNEQVQSTLYYYGEDWTPVAVDVTSYDILNWQDGQGGNEQDYFYDGMALAPGLCSTLWPPTAWPQALTNGTVAETEWDNYITPPDVWSNTYTAFPPTLTVEHCDVNQTIDRYGSRERRTADTELKLATGGPLGSTRQNLWAISGSGTDTATGQPIPCDQIQVGTLGKLGSDGKFYVVLPDNDPGRVELAGATNRQATYSASSDKLGVTIMAKEVALSDARVASGANFCVGQIIKFELGGVPAGVVATNFQWNFEGSYVNDYIAPPDDHTFVIFTNDPTLLKKAVVDNCIWTSGDSSPPENYQASVSCLLVFTNGNPARPLNVSGKFSMYRPTLYDYTPLLPNAEVTTNNLLLATSVGGFYVSVRSAFGGLAGATQLVQGWETNCQPAGFDTSGRWALDTREFYITADGNPSGLLPVTPRAPASGTNNAVYVADRPGISCVGNTSMHLDFKDYIRFRPEPGPSIAVTLAEVNWHIYATAGVSNSVYVLTSPVGRYTDYSYTDSSRFAYITNIVVGTN